MISIIKDFFRAEAASSVLLAVMVVLAMIAANTPLYSYYEWLHAPLAVTIINDGLMAFFFLVIGIELKREMVEGELSSWGQALLPVAATIGGVVVPALIYMYFNMGTEAMRGWAIPMATDIAFALGIIGIFGKRLPPALRVFLLAVAVIDDIFAIVVIAVFYTAELSVQALGMSAGILALLFVYNRRVVYMAPFLFAGAALWIALHESGIHATLAGVFLGLLMPLPKGKKVLHVLHHPVGFFVVPLFVFANSGINFGNISEEMFAHPVFSGIAVGLFAGKQLGVFAAAWLMIRIGFARLPTGSSLLQLYSVCVVAGIGFTMSLFIGTLAFGHDEMMVETRLGVIVGSLASALFGAILLWVTLPVKERV